MFFELAGMLLLPFVGSTFFSLGFFTLFRHLQLISKGELIDGEVVAIEYFRSISPRTSDGHKTKIAYYSSIVQFSWNGEDHKIASIGANEIRHQLKQTVPVYVLTNSQGELVKASVKEMPNVVLPTVFLILGLAVGAIAHTQLNAPLIYLGAFVLSFLVIGGIISAKIDKTMKFTPHEPRMDSRMIENAEDMQMELSKNSKIAYVLGALPILGSAFLFYSAYNKLNHSDQASFNEDLWSFISTLMEQGPKAGQQDFVNLAGVGLFFLLAGLYSLVYTRIKGKQLAPSPSIK
ncbi:MAG: hypothetical protein P1V97_07700 [Planctomycetota bacterium]|nr:hypothetical protein [Planctomycetota bacterium]